MDKTTIVILGATGDLATRRLIPALFHLVEQKKLTDYLIVGAALTECQASDVLSKSKKYIKNVREDAWDNFTQRFLYCSVNFKQAKDFERLSDHIVTCEKQFDMPGNRLVYLAISPTFFCSVTKQLSQAGIIRKQGSVESPWYRVIYEKPFGHDSSSARALNECIAHYLDESQIFRIDHYLAKNIVGNIVLLRFTNRVLEPLWNKENIAWVEIMLSETVGLKGRGHYYDDYGALNDVVQNHILQIIALIAMEAPVYLSGEFIRDEKARVLKHMRAVDLLLGQYEGYTKEDGVAPDSKTETFAAAQLMIDNQRWQGVPFYVRTGKALDKKETVITIQFKDVKCLLQTSCPTDPNYLQIRVMPEPGFALVLNVKKPGMLEDIEPIAMDFSYEKRFGKVPENAYEVLLQEVLKGEPSVSVRVDEIEYAWDVIDALKKLERSVYKYKKGSYGPEEIQEFAKKHTMRWRL